MRGHILERNAVDYVLVDRRVGALLLDDGFACAENGAGGDEPLTLVPSFENEHSAVYTVVRNNGTVT